MVYVTLVALDIHCRSGLHFVFGRSSDIGTPPDYIPFEGNRGGVGPKEGPENGPGIPGLGDVF